MRWGYVSTPTGGRVSCQELPDGSWVSTCDSCGEADYGSQEQVRAYGRNHLETRVMCAYRPRSS